MAIIAPPTGTRAANVDATRLNKTGNQLIGQTVVLKRWILMFQKACVQTPDAKEKAIYTEIVHEMQKDLQKVSDTLHPIAIRCGALQWLDEAKA